MSARDQIIIHGAKENNLKTHKSYDSKKSVNCIYRTIWQW